MTHEKTTDDLRFRSLPIDAALRRNLARMGYDEPTPIQHEFFAPVIAGRDAIGLAKTGTGKTTAFLLPIAERLIAGAAATARRGAGRLRALVLCPTRELALQVTDEASRLMRGCGIRGICVHGKVAITPQAEALAKGVDLLVATPGRLRELLEAGALDLSSVRIVVLDEADRMLDMGFDPQVRLLLDRIPGDRQTLMLTATMPRAVERLAADLLRTPVRVEVDPTTTAVTHVRQRLFAVDDALKVPMVLALLAGADGAAERHGVLVFCRTRRRAGWIGTALRRHRHTVGALHGDRSHKQRTAALSRFARGTYRVLVATDVASRGLHIDAVRTVITYDLPLSPEDHVHRIGRAAHGLEGRGGEGEAFVLLAPEDRDRWEEVVEMTGVSVERERPLKLDAFMVHAPERTRRAIDRAPTPRAPRDGSDARSRSGKARRVGTATDGGPKSKVKRGASDPSSETRSGAGSRKKSRGGVAGGEDRDSRRSGSRSTSSRRSSKPKKMPRIGTGVRQGPARE